MNAVDRGTQNSEFMWGYAPLPPIQLSVIRLQGAGVAWLILSRTGDLSLRIVRQTDAGTHLRRAVWQGVPSRSTYFSTSPLFSHAAKSWFRCNSSPRDADCASLCHSPLGGRYWVWFNLLVTFAHYHLDRLSTRQGKTPAYVLVAIRLCWARPTVHVCEVSCLCRVVDLLVVFGQRLFCACSRGWLPSPVCPSWTAALWACCLDEAAWSCQRG